MTVTTFHVYLVLAAACAAISFLSYSKREWPEVRIFAFLTLALGVHAFLGFTPSGQELVRKAASVPFVVASMKTPPPFVAVRY